MNITPRLGRVSYGAGELKRVYVKHMASGFILSVICTLILVSPLWFLVDQELFNPAPQRVIRIFKYSEIELPRPLSDVDFGLSAYPILQTRDFSSDDDPLSVPLLTKGVALKKSGFPKERTANDAADGLPKYGGAEKLSSDESGEGKQQWGNKNAPKDRNDIPGGSGESKEPWRKGGVPLAGKSGEPPIGFDRSGVGSSSKPSAEGTPYALGTGADEDGEGGGGFSMRWLQGMTRRKISGELPKYPAGTNVSAQVKILTIVRPNGTVKSVQPVQKANRLLEETAMKAVLNWKFEPLGTALAQVRQSCVITFSFKVK